MKRVGTENVRQIKDSAADILVETIIALILFYKQRIKKLLVEMERRYKAGGIIDKRFILKKRCWRDLPVNDR